MEKISHKDFGPTTGVTYVDEPGSPLLGSGKGPEHRGSLNEMTRTEFNRV
jgi:hypothetical protein